MKRRSFPPPLDIALALGTGAAVALIFAVGVNALGAPKDFDRRIATVNDTADRAEAALRPVRQRGGYPVAALCTRSAGEQARLLGETVTGEATRAALVVDALETRSEIVADPAVRVTPVRLRFSVSGPYEGAVGLLGRLSREQPGLFVDSLSLTPKVSSVSLSFSGRVFCAA